jgi:hypothetical protein
MIAIHLLFQQVFYQHGGHALGVSGLPAWWSNACCLAGVLTARCPNTDCFGKSSDWQASGHLLLLSWPLLFQQVFRQPGGRTPSVSAGVQTARWADTCCTAGALPFSEALFENTVPVDKSTVSDSLWSTFFKIV